MSTDKSFVLLCSDTGFVALFDSHVHHQHGNQTFLQAVRIPDCRGRIAVTDGTESGAISLCEYIVGHFAECLRVDVQHGCAVVFTNSVQERSEPEGKVNAGDFHPEEPGTDVGTQNHEGHQEQSGTSVGQEEPENANGKVNAGDFHPEEPGTDVGTQNHEGHQEQSDFCRARRT